MALTLTSANSVLLLSVAGIFSTPQQIQGYAADDAFDVDAVTRAQVLMGVDGRKSAGYMPAVKPLNIHLQADSPSFPIFETWYTTEDAASETYPASGTLSIPSIGRVYTLTNGTLMTVNYLAAGKKILQPRTFSVVFGQITPAPT